MREISSSQEEPRLVHAFEHLPYDSAATEILTIAEHFDFVPGVLQVEGDLVEASSPADFGRALASCNSTSAVLEYNETESNDPKMVAAVARRYLLGGH